MEKKACFVSVALLQALGGLACLSPKPQKESRRANKTAESAVVAVADTVTKPVVAAEVAAVSKVATMDESQRQELRNAASDALQAINFAFDSADIRDLDKPKLLVIAEFMKRFGKARLQIEGHCDERGAVEYNLSLGERRAGSARAYLVALGIPENRLSTISYGKDRPVVCGKDEPSWEYNRRCEFKLQTEVVYSNR